MKILFDMASVIQTGLRKGQCDEYWEVEHEGKKVKINPAEHGYENAVGYMVECIDKFNLHPSDIIMVFEGLDSKKRRMQIMPTYKGSREKSHPDYYKEYARCKDMVKAAFRDVGALAVTQKLAEGDDTLKFLAWMLEEDVVIVTNDGDLSVLAGVSPKGHKITVMSGQDINKMPSGVYEARHITLYKSLVGDANDTVPGIRGFGQAKWDQLLVKYGGDGIDQISEAVAKNDQDTIFKFAQQNKCPLLSVISENWNAVRTCWKVVHIYPEWVNTRYYPLEWEPGMVKGKGSDERLHKYAQVAILVTAGNYDEALARLKGARKKWPTLPASFDLETSTDEESDDWMEAQGKPDGVDPIGSYICGFSISFGPGGRFTYYVSVKHHDTDNVTMKQAREMIEEIHGVAKPIHNASFELAVLYNDHAKDEDGTLWRDHWKDKGEFGFMPNIEDTLLMASYVDENAMQRNLKALSRNVLGYDQVDFNTMRTFRIDSTMQVRWNLVGEGKDAKMVPEGYHEGFQKPWPGGKVFTKTEKTPVYEDGKQLFNKNGKPKEAVVHEIVQAIKPDGTLDTVRKRNPETGVMDNLPKMVKVPKTYLEVRYKMHEMPAAAVFNYGTDDTICTMGYYIFAKTHMIIDEHYHVYRKVEIDAAYQHAKNYVDGFPIAIHELVKQRNDDAEVLRKSEETLHSYLLDKGWAGTVQPVYGADISAAQIKEAYATVFGIVEPDDEDENAEDVEIDPVMAYRAKLPAKFIDLIAAQEREGAEIFAGHLRNLVENGKVEEFNKYVGLYFDGKPRFNYGNKDMAKLLYEAMGMTVKVRNKATQKMRDMGQKQGTPKADTLAVDYAVMEATEKGMSRELEVLKALKLITMVNTRNGLFYKPYPGFVHWETGKVHSSHRQCHANTRRGSSASPNMQQMSAHEKIEGYEPRIRAVVQPHAPDAVIVSMDFNAQELRLIADDSKDPNMLACYVGEHKKDMHSITGSMIWLKKSETAKQKVAEVGGLYATQDEATYAAFVAMATSEDQAEVKAYKEYRSLGKKINFTALYGAMAEKVAATLMVSEDDAQLFLDAREAAFKVSELWKEQTIVASAKELGYVRSRLGAKRHLAQMFDSGDRYISSKAERQASNFRIQGSAAEMTKLAEGRMWRRGLTTRFPAVILGPIHDEVVASVKVSHLREFLKEMHACMVEPYADMQVEVKSSIEFGPNMQDLIEIGMEPTDAAIDQGLAKLKALYPEYA
jgi:hypothetical protein